MTVWLFSGLYDGCPHCGERFQDGDLVDLLDAMDGIVAHTACVKEGVERWCRENRPGDGPLAWHRDERPRYAQRARDGGRLRAEVRRPEPAGRPGAAMGGDASDRLTLTL